MIRHEESRRNTVGFQDMTLLSGDGYPLALRFYETDAPKAVVKFIHGMEEYQDRYQPFAEYLQAAGYTVVTADLRGHGPSAPILSHIADKDGHQLLLEDEEAILEEIHARWPGVPVILFAHSSWRALIISIAFIVKSFKLFFAKLKTKNT